MTKPVDKKLYRNYLLKSEELLEVAQYAANHSKSNAAVTASVHSAINAVDALAVFYFGRRHSGGHEEAMNTVKGAFSQAEFREMAKQFSGLIALKNEAEYQPDLMKETQGREAVTRASRILSKVRSKLPQE